MKNNIEKKERLEQSVNQKIDIIISAGNLLRMVEDDTPENIIQAGKIFFNQSFGKFPFSVKKKFEVGKKIKDDIEEIQNAYILKSEIEEEDFCDLSADDPSVIEIERLYEKLHSLYRGHEGDDVLFFEKLEDFFHSLADKRCEVIKLKDQYKKDPQVFLTKLGCFTNLNNKHLYIQDVNKIDFKGINVNIFLEKNVFNRNINNTDGFHVVGTPINIVENNERTERVLTHEQNHNLYESFTSSPTYREKVVEDFQRLKSLVEFGAPNIVIETNLKKIKKQISNYTACLYQEILADLDFLSAGDLAYLKYALEAEKIFKNNLDRSCLKNDSIRNDLLDSVDISTNLSMKFFEKLSKACWAAKKIGKFKQFKAAMLLFDQKNFGKVIRYMKQFPEFDKYYIFAPLFFGEGAYGVLCNNDKRSVHSLFEAIFGEYSNFKKLNQNLSFDGFFRPKNITKVAKKIDGMKDYKGQVSLSVDCISYKLVNEMSTVNFYELINEDEEEMFLNLEYLKSYRKDLSHIFSSLRVNNKKIEQSNTYSLIYYVTSLILERKNFTLLQTLCDNFPCEKEAIIDSLITNCEIYKNEWKPDNVNKLKLKSFIDKNRLDVGKNIQ